MILNTDPMRSEAFAPDSDTARGNSTDSGPVPSDYDETRIEPGTGLSGFRVISESGIPRRALTGRRLGPFCLFFIHTDPHLIAATKVAVSVFLTTPCAFVL